MLRRGGGAPSGANSLWSSLAGREGLSVGRDEMDDVGVCSLVRQGIAIREETGAGGVAGLKRVLIASSAGVLGIIAPWQWSEENGIGVMMSFGPFALHYTAHQTNACESLSIYCSRSSDYHIQAPVPSQQHTRLQDEPLNLPYLPHRGSSTSLLEAVVGTTPTYTSNKNTYDYLHTHCSPSTDLETQSRL